ncbi:MAG: hypothetical protein J6X39_00915, partial [Bacteroidales bacterium]|nr:hypothetical protein [Bacteroidales bacterium]
MRPYRVLLFIASVLACLAALCVVLPGRITFGSHSLRWPTLAEVFETKEPIPVDTLLSPSGGPGGSIPTPDTLLPPSGGKGGSITDSRMFLAAFYASLAESGSKVVRVLHYGDSPIEEDRMSQQIREALQARYGGQGCGLMPLAQTIPNKTVNQQLRMNGRFIQPAQGPRRYLVYGPKRD